jgi:CHAT domain-containing protein
MGYVRSIVLAGLVMGLIGSQILELPAVAQSSIAQNGAPNLEAIQGIQNAAEALKQGRYDVAIEAFNKLLKDNPKDPMIEYFALSGMGLAYTALEQYSSAIDYYEKSLPLARQLKTLQLEGPLLFQLATPHIAMGNYAKGLDYCDQSLAIARASRNRQDELSVLVFVGETYNKLGNAKKAMDYIQQAIPIAQELNNRSQLARLISARGSSYRLLSDYPQALTNQKQALVMFRELNNRNGEQTSLMNLGNVSFSLKQYREAIQYQEQSLNLAQALNDGEGQQTILYNLSSSHHALGEHPKAMTLAAQSLAIARQRKDHYGEGLALASLGFGDLRGGRLAEAETSLRSAATRLESLRVGLNDTNKVALSNAQTFLYEVLQETLVKQNRPEAALEAAERGRARAFIELLSSRLQNKSQEEIQALAEFPNLDKIRQIAKAQNATLVEYSFVENSFINDKKQLYIWVIKPTGEIQFKISKFDSSIPLGELIQQSRSSIAITGDKPPETDAPEELNLALNKLHQSLIAPIASALPTDPNQRVIFLPQGELFLVPFAALRDAKGKYLIEQHTISTAPSIHTLALTQEKAKRTSRNGKILVVGDPTMPKIPGVTLSDLPGARAEAIAIAQLLKTTPLIGNQATKATVLQQMNQASIIHLATHGLLGTLKGDIPGAIVLAPSGSDNGFLTSSEIFDLKINPDLLVLSACDTGGGDITGDGVIGLSRSFIAAGAPSLLVSLWAVNDDSTSALMQAFYPTLKTNPNKAQALRSSMLSTMKKYPNPRYWAAFTLVGES